MMRRSQCAGVVLSTPAVPEAVPDLETAEQAVAEARRREHDIALEIQGIEAERVSAENVRGRVAPRFSRGGAVGLAGHSRSAQGPDGAPAPV